MKRELLVLALMLSACTAPKEEKLERLRSGDCVLADSTFYSSQGEQCEVVLSGLLSSVTKCRSGEYNVPNPELVKLKRLDCYPQFK